MTNLLESNAKPTPKPSAVSLQMRDVLFGDIPWAQWCRADSPNIEPWSSFKRACAALVAGNGNAAIKFLMGIVTTPGYETRIYAQAWYFLRELGQTSNEPKRLFGVVIEVGLEDGLDVLCAYEDHTARYWNFSGSGVVWERPDNSVDIEIDDLFKASRIVVQKIGPWDKPRLDAPTQGMVRLSFLTPSGLHFGQGPLTVFAKDPMAGPVIQRGSQLMQKLISKTQKRG